MVNDYKKYFIFNGKKSSDFDVWASGLNIFHSPERRIERIQVPGRNGELLIEDGSFENVELLFKDCFIPRHFSENFTNLSNYLNRQKGYQRLELSWLPDEYRLAAFHGDIEASMKNWDGMGKFDLAFNCKPQRFLKSGEEPIFIMPPLNGTSTPSLYDFRQKGTTVRLLKMPESGSVSFKINYWDSGSEAVSIPIGTATSIGWEYTVQTVLPTAYWNVEATLGAGDDPDDLMFEIEGNYRGASGWEYVRAICGRRLEFTNPTGFVCRPTFEINGTIFPIHWISNEDENGNTTEEWVINCDDYSDLTTDAVIDCENEYFYYTDANGKKQNITGKMTMTHYVDGEQKFPSFPKLGASKTVIYNYITGGYTDCFVRMYPHWFTI